MTLNTYVAAGNAPQPGLEGEQDLINAAAVETLRGHGEVYMLDQGEIRGSSPIAAVLRYSAWQGCVEYPEMARSVCDLAQDSECTACSRSISMVKSGPTTASRRIEGEQTIGGDTQLKKHVEDELSWQPREVSRLIGVKDVINDVEVRPSRTPVSAEIKTGIEAALKRSAEVEARRVHVEIHGNTVVLTGAVSSWPERNAAERAAWSSPGVSKVENKLSLSTAMVTAG